MNLEKLRGLWYQVRDVLLLQRGDREAFWTAGFHSVQFTCLVVSDSLRPVVCSMESFSVHHQLPELDQTHVHYVSDATQPSHSLSGPSAFNLPQHHDIFQ